MNEETVPVDITEEAPEVNPAPASPKDDGVMRFTTKRKEVPVEIENEDTGVTDHYILREFLGGAREQHLDEQFKRMDMNEEGKVVGMKSYLGSESGLIARCLFLIIATGEKPVSIGTIQKFPQNVQRALSDKCKEICGLNEEAGEEAKNE